jgi:hypothetical protein
VKEPAGWQGDTEKAKLYQANILFHRPATDPGKPEGVIRVRVSSKEDENTEADLKADMDGYRQQFPQAQFPSLTAAHPSYRALARRRNDDPQLIGWHVFGPSAATAATGC